MYKRPEDLEALKMEELERLEGIGVEQQSARTKGHARIALRAKGPYLQECLRQFITLPRIVDDLGEQGIDVSVASLRKWLMEFLADDYAEYLQITGRGRKKNRAGAVPETPEKPKQFEQPQQKDVSTIDAAKPVSADDPLRAALTAAAQPRSFRKPGDNS